MTHPAASYARELVAALAAHGVRDYVLCPGSRSGPLAHALAQASSDNPPLGAPKVNLHVRIDERAAGFVALGIAKALEVEGDPRPVAIVTTSGTAVGNLLPAVMEAHHTGVPLVLLTADRPSEMRGVGANQTTDQEGLFGTFVRWTVNSAAPQRNENNGRATLLAARAVHWAMGHSERDDAAAAPGPVHVNLEFREPLGHDGGPWPMIDLEKPTLMDRARGRLRALNLTPKSLPDVERAIVIAGDGAGDVARKVAEAHGWPLFAEPTSRARSGPNAIGGYVEALGTAAGQELAQKASQVVLIGRATLSRPVQQLIAAAPALYVAAHGARWREAPRHAERVLATVPDEWLTPPERTSEWAEASGVDSRWLVSWRRVSRGLVGGPYDWGQWAVAARFMASLGGDDVALLGSSGPIRAVDAVAPVWPAGEGPILVANRGLAGIDGTVSTAIGLALGLDRPVSALMGDVTFVHDAGGLLIGPTEKRPDVRIVVVNDGGGTIFRRLEHAQAPSENVTRVFTTPHAVGIASLAKAYGASHVKVRDAEKLRAVLAQPILGIEIVEAVL